MIIIYGNHNGFMFIYAQSYIELQSKYILVVVARIGNNFQTIHFIGNTGTHTLLQTQAESRSLVMLTMKFGDKVLGQIFFSEKNVSFEKICLHNFKLVFSFHPTLFRFIPLNE